MDSRNLVLERLASARNVDDIASVIRNAARGLVGSDGVTFIVREGDFCHYLEVDAIGPLWRGQRFPMTACVSGWVMQRAEPVAIPDIYADPRVPRPAYRPTFVKSMAMVPIGRPAPFGAIGAYWATRHEPTINELEMLQAIADSAALALQDD